MKFITLITGLLESFSRLFSKYGIANTLKYTVIVVLIAFFGYTSYCLITLDTRIDNSVKQALTEQTKETQQTHTEGVEKRMNNMQTINSTIKETMLEVGADRASIIEMHNGTNNMAGLPFLYGEMTYEQVNDDIEHVDDNYAKLNLTRYTFPQYLIEKSYFKGNMVDVKKHDDKIASKMEKDGCKYIIVYLIYGNKQPIGFFAVTWDNTDSPEITSDDLSKISVTAQKLAQLLN